MPYSAFAQFSEDDDEEELLQEDPAGFALTITPPLFQLSISPGETWSSGIKVVNTNPYDITVYTQPMNFSADGDEGRSSFAPLIPDGNALGNWIQVQEGPIVIPQEKTTVIPFTVTIPENAPPGGHYASIFIGNRPPRNQDGNSVTVTSNIATLLFVRVAGDIIERGLIRDFYTGKAFYQRPEAEFELRFQNLGNVHLQPQGDVLITNMWGKERGSIPINQKSDFGNVLPQQDRKFTFSWEGEYSLYDIGRYKAIATLAYGKMGRQNIVRTTHFWVLPIWTALQVLGGLIIVLFFFIWSIKRYVRRALRMEAELYGIPQTDIESNDTPKKTKQEEPSLELKTLVRPLTAGVVDLKNIRSISSKPARPQARTKQTRTMQSDETLPVRRRREQKMSLLGFLWQYKLFFLFIAVLIAAIAFVISIITDMITGERGYKVEIDRPDGTSEVIEATTTDRGTESIEPPVSQQEEEFSLNPPEEASQESSEILEVSSDELQ